MTDNTEMFAYLDEPKLEHYGVKNMGWYKHTFGKYQNQSRYASIFGKEYQERSKKGKEERKARLKSRKVDEANTDVEKGHNKNYYKKQASSKAIRNVSTGDLIRMTNRLNTENGLKGSIENAKKLSNYEQKTVRGLISNIFNGNNSYYKEYKSIYKNKEMYSDDELRAIKSRLDAENNFRAAVDVSKGKLSPGNYQKIMSDFANRALYEALSSNSVTNDIAIKVDAYRQGIPINKNTKADKPTMVEVKAAGKAKRKAIDEYYENTTETSKDKSKDLFEKRYMEAISKAKSQGQVNLIKRAKTVSELDTVLADIKKYEKNDVDISKALKEKKKKK